MTGKQKRRGSLISRRRRRRSEGFAINKPSRTLTETSIRFHPVRVLAFVVSHFAPVTNFHVMAGFHYVGNVVLRVHLEHGKHVVYDTI